MLLCTVARPAFAVDTIPFTRVNGGLIEVQGSVDGATPVPMLVNLGAGVDVLSTELGRRFVVVRGKYVSLRLTGERVDLPIGTVLSLALGRVQLEAPNVGIWSGLDGTGLSRLISATAFRNIATTFDFHNNQIVIEDAQTFPARIRSAIRLPVILQDDLGIPSISLVGARETAVAQPTVSVGNLIYDCDVGNSFWEGRAFTLDLPNLRIYVTTPS